MKMRVCKWMRMRTRTRTRMMRTETGVRTRQKGSGVAQQAEPTWLTEYHKKGPERAEATERERGERKGKRGHRLDDREGDAEGVEYRPVVEGERCRDMAPEGGGEIEQREEEGAKEEEGESLKERE